MLITKGDVKGFRMLVLLDIHIALIPVIFLHLKGLSYEIDFENVDEN